MRSRTWPQIDPHTLATHSRWTPYRDRAPPIHMSNAMPVGADTRYPIAQQSWRGNYSVPTIPSSKTAIPQQYVGMQEVTQHLEAVLLHLAEAVLLHLAEAEVEAEDGEEAEADLVPRMNLQVEMRE